MVENSSNMEMMMTGLAGAPNQEFEGRIHAISTTSTHISVLPPLAEHIPSSSSYPT